MKVRVPVTIKRRLYAGADAEWVNPETEAAFIRCRNAVSQRIIAR
jgi:hypothetical protein